jgi:hypothetical protein
MTLATVERSASCGGESRNATSLSHKPLRNPVH